MAPLSIKSNFFALDESKADSVLGGYTHKKLEVLKLKGETAKGCSYSWKSVWNLKGNGFQFTDDASFGMTEDLFGRYFQVKVNRKGDLKYHYELGTLKLMDKNIDVWA